MLLSVQSISIHRGSTLLAEDFSCALAPGQAAWLTGPNGAGKSTLLGALAGLRLPLRGSVTRTDDFIYQPTQSGFDAGLTLQQNLSWWAAVHAADAGRIDAALAFWQLQAQACQPYGSLSQGQRQRAALARLSISKARLWLLDEPLTHLDAAGAGLFQQAARRHLASGGVLLAATHATDLLPEAPIHALRGVDA